MPDLQTELSKVIHAWEAPETSEPASAKPVQRPFQITTNTSRATFDYVRDNPGVSRVQATSALGTQGHKRTSVSSLLVQMLKQGLLRDSNGALFVTQPEYAPIKARLVKPAKPVKAPATKRKPKAQAPVAAPKAEAPVPTEFDAEEFVNALTRKQAKAVFVKLKEVFA